MNLSVGMMNFPTEWKNKSHVPNYIVNVFIATGEFNDSNNDIIPTNMALIKTPCVPQNSEFFWIFIIIYRF